MSGPVSTMPLRSSMTIDDKVACLVSRKAGTIRLATASAAGSGATVAGAAAGRGGLYPFVPPRGPCAGRGSKISWTQVETGSAITWKYPSVILQGDYATGEFYSVAVVNNKQQADTGTKMIHIGRNTKSTIISKGISAGEGQNSYRGQVKVMVGGAPVTDQFAADIGADGFAPDAASAATLVGMPWKRR